MSDSKSIIQARLLNNIDSTYDTTEGSFFYDVEMPVAIELETSYSELDAILDNGFPDTAKDEYLEKIVSEQGITRKSAGYGFTSVVVNGTIGANIPLGGLVSTDVVNFEFTESITIDSAGQATVGVQCTTIGTAGNVPIGAIKYFPIILQGLTSVTNLTAVTNGYDKETDAELKIRYYAKVQTPSTAGNKYDYINWAKSVTGCGDAKCFPLWNGNGTVQVVIINSNKRAADSILIASVASYIETVRPIGAIITVISATEVPISISATLTIDSKNYTLAQIITAVENNITAYLKSIAFINSYVSYANMGSTIFNTDGVEDYSNLLINGGTANIAIADAQIAVLGGVALG